ncbi:Uncharacterised protein [Mycobacteroides abscessus subsp. abscessus]|nr:Uncharacterised protein [Mycobacteroides abscessus subsp. abscessus]
MVAIATFVSDTSAVLQDPYVFTNSLMEGRDPGLLVSSVTSTAYVALILVQLIWTGARNVSRTPVGIGLLMERCGRGAVSGPGFSLFLRLE